MIAALMAADDDSPASFRQQLAMAGGDILALASFLTAKDHVRMCLMSPKA